MVIDFEYETEYGLFSDALWFPDDEPLPPEDEIEAMKLQRLNEWLNFFKLSSKAEPAPNVELAPVIEQGE